MRICFALAAMLFVVHAASAADPAAPKASDVLKPRKQNDLASPITDRFALRVTDFDSSIETQFRLDPDNGPPGTDLVAENDLGMPDKENQARMELIIRLAQRNRLRVDYFKLARFGDTVLNQQIVFGNSTFNITDRAQTMLDWRQLGFTYTRSVWLSERLEVGVGLGVAFLEAKARGAVTARNIREERSAVGGFPTFALDGTWRISKRWSLNGRWQRFSAHVNDFQGAMGDYHGDFQYRWRGNFALGLGYSRLHSVVNIANSSFAGRFDQNVAGPELFIRASF